MLRSMPIKRTYLYLSLFEMQFGLVGPEHTLQLAQEVLLHGELGLEVTQLRVVGHRGHRCAGEVVGVEADLQRRGQLVVLVTG